MIRQPENYDRMRPMTEGNVPDVRRMMYVQIPQETSGQEAGGAVISALLLLRSRWWLVALVAALCTGIWTIITFLETPQYQAKITLEIAAPREQVMGMATGAQASRPETYLQTEVKSLETRTVRGRVLTVMRDRNLLTGYESSNLAQRLRRLLGVRQPITPKVAVPSFTTKVSHLENTDVIEITCDSPDPVFSANYLNTLADEFASVVQESRWEGYVQTSQWLSRQLADSKAQLERAEQALQQYSTTSGFLFVDETDSVHSEKLKQLQQELLRANGERVARQSAYEVATGSAEDSVPNVMDNERLSTYQVKLAELRRTLAELSSLYTPEHYRVQQMKAQIAEVEDTYRRERASVLLRIRNEFVAAQRREQLLQTTFNAQAQVVADQNSRAIHYNVLKRDVEINRQTYGALLQRVKEASVASALSASSIHIMDPAVAPGSPSKPNLISNIMKGLGSGLLLGIFLIVAMDRVNRSLRAPGETPFHLHVPELGVIPVEVPESRLHPVNVLLPPLSGSNRWKSDDRVELVTLQNGNSIMAESFRSTLASVLLSNANGRRPQVLLVTSANRGEGKSTTASNLAIALAEINQRVLLIDGDMRKPRLHTLFGVGNSWGISDVLLDRTQLRRAPLEALARKTNISNLWLLPSGPGTLSISNLLYSERMEHLVQRFRETFDTILIDTPPMLAISDARVLGRLADAAILIISAGSTTRDAAMAAKARLAEDGIPLIGTVLNNYDRKAKTRYGHYGDGYYQ